MIHDLRLQLLPQLFAVCRLPVDAPIPDWAELAPSAAKSKRSFGSVARTADELSIVCPEVAVPDGVQCERGWRALRVAGTLDFSIVGVVASLAAPLAEAGVSIFVISTFDTDYLLIKEGDLDRAAQTLAKAGHTVVTDN